MILEIITKDFIEKCENCKYFETENHIDGKYVNLLTKIRSWNRYRNYNSKSCVQKEEI